MDTASLIGLVTSVDVGSLKPVLFGIQDFISAIFAGVTGSITGSTEMFAGANDIVQEVLSGLGES